MPGSRIEDVLTQPHNRRTALTTALAIAAGAGVVAPASAARGWCRCDPIVLIDGILVDIFCTAPLSALLLVTGPTEVKVTVPEDVSAKLVLTDLGFGRGEKVTFATSSDLEQTDDHIEVKVDVFVPAREDLPIGVEFAPRIIGILNPERAEGFANSVITLTAELDVDGLLGILGLREQRERRERSKRHKRHKRRRRR